MSGELTRIAVKLFKNLSDALLRTAYELDPPNSQAPITESIFIENPKIESLEVENSVVKRSWVVSIDRVLHLKKG